MEEGAPHPRRGGSGRVVTDYNSYTEGDEEPYLCKQIDTLIVKDTNYIVYLDQDGAVEWACTPAYGNVDGGAAEVLNGVSAHSPRFRSYLDHPEVPVPRSAPGGT
jgi:hypothetical protein